MRPPPPPPGRVRRLGVYADLVYRRDDAGFSADRAFVDFVTGLPPRVDEVVLFGRLDPEPGRHPHALPADGVRFVALPHYGSLRDARGLARAWRASHETFERELPGLDAVWLFGPHPLALRFARAARRRGVPVFLGVRQELPRYVGRRAAGASRLVALPAAHALERAWRRLARTAPAVVVGEELARQYAGGAPVLATGFSLVRDEDVLPLEAGGSRDWAERPLELLSVGRLDPEKNPVLLPEVLRRLGGNWKLTVVGVGPLEDDVRQAAAGLDIDFAGYLAGDALRERYRHAHAFLHVSLTEGFPQVIFEAQAALLPVVATDVGGVRAAIADTALLVPPDDAATAAGAVARLEAEPELRARLVRAGRENAARETREAQLDRIAAFLEESV